MKMTNKKKDYIVGAAFSQSILKRVLESYVLVNCAVVFFKISLGFMNNNSELMNETFAFSEDVLQAILKIFLIYGWLGLLATIVWGTIVLMACISNFDMKRKFMMLLIMSTNLVTSYILIWR